MARERLQRLSPAVWLDGLAAGLASAALAAALVLQPLREVAPDPLTAALYPLGCDMAQGYHLSPPLPAAGLDRWLEGSGVAVAASDP
jgi:predicted signal transduction protein with EAL and GGDEF domain